jgi:hypothetical protein
MPRFEAYQLAFMRAYCRVLVFVVALLWRFVRINAGSVHRADRQSVKSFAF